MAGALHAIALFRARQKKKNMKNKKSQVPISLGEGMTYQHLHIMSALYMGRLAPFNCFIQFSSITLYSPLIILWNPCHAGWTCSNSDYVKRKNDSTVPGSSMPECLFFFGYDCFAGKSGSTVATRPLWTTTRPAMSDFASVLVVRWNRSQSPIIGAISPESI